MEEDNLLLRNHEEKKGNAVLIGKPVRNEHFKKLFNKTDTASKYKNVNFFVDSYYEKYVNE